MANIQIPQDYKTKIKNRTFFHFCKGIFPRVLKYIKFAFFRFVARRKGAIIGANTNLNVTTQHPYRKLLVNKA